MTEYDLVCDICGKAVQVADGIISWTADGSSERGFALTHPACVPPGATERIDVRAVVGPNGYLDFVTGRLGRTVAEPEPLRAIVWALAPFVMRPDNPAEMDSMRAASFGQRPGVKPEPKVQEAAK